MIIDRPDIARSSGLLYSTYHIYRLQCKRLQFDEMQMIYLQISIGIIILHHINQ